MARSSYSCTAASSHHYATHWPLQRVYDSPPPGQTLAHALHLPHRSRSCNVMRSDLDPSPTSFRPAFRLHDMLMCLHLTSIIRSHTMPLVRRVCCVTYAQLAHEHGLRYTARRSLQRKHAAVVRHTRTFFTGGFVLPVNGMDIDRRTYGRALLRDD